MLRCKTSDGGKLTSECSMYTLHARGGVQAIHHNPAVPRHACGDRVRCMQRPTACFPPHVPAPVCSRTSNRCVCKTRCVTRHLCGGAFVVDKCHRKRLVGQKFDPHIRTHATVGALVELQIPPRHPHPLVRALCPKRLTNLDDLRVAPGFELVR